MSSRSTSLVATMALAILVAACSGSGDENPGLDGGGNPWDGGNTNIKGFEGPLKQGMSWKLKWTTEHWGASSGTDKYSGELVITLGKPHTIKGITGYALHYCGVWACDMNKQWKYLALHQSRLLASDKGTDWTTVFDAVTGQWPGKGFLSWISGKGALWTARPQGGGVWAASVIKQVKKCEYYPGVGTICGSEDPKAQAAEDLFRAKQIIEGYSYHYSYASDYRSDEEGKVVSFTTNASTTCTQGIKLCHQVPKTPEDGGTPGSDKGPTDGTPPPPKDKGTPPPPKDTGSPPPPKDTGSPPPPKDTGSPPPPKDTGSLPKDT